MRIKWSALLVPAMLLAWTTASADDGDKTLKEMTVGNVDPQLAVTPGEVGVPYADAEHAFIDMMKFYVPAQAANGTPFLPLEYDNVEETLVETLAVAKPLVSVFIYGPTIEVEDTAFAHSYMDTFAAVSLDDGLTWKKTNLSESADKSSFTLGVDGSGDGGDDGDDVPADHTKIEKDDGLIAFHKPGMDFPYTNECTECHGNTLQGGHHGEPSCYSCHGPEWKEDAPDDVIVVYIEEAYAKLDSAVKIKLEVEGEVEGADEGMSATLINGVTDLTLATEELEDDGEFEFELEYSGLPPCTVTVIVDGVESGTVPVIDKRTKEPVENCEGEPHDLTIYPGGTYNVFHATAGNKVLVAWPSRYCQQGQPSFSFAYDADPDEVSTDPNPVKRQQIADYLGIDPTIDLYLTDLFGVAGSQRSIDFADEGYPQAGVVPFGCVWTARGVLLPGDDPRTGDVSEESHMVWTKAERLTSGRRDPNRIEVKGVKGAGFVITWQEDPDGLRPGQGLGPGEGWSGAVAHDKTDVWYSFIPWEHFDIVEGPETAPDPINIAEHDLLLSGRPQVFVPMAVPMRLTNNDKCNAEFFGPNGAIDPTDPRYFSYCNYDVAYDYGLQNFCETTVQVPTGQSGELADICVNEDDLPNIANTASTRPRTSLQGYDVDGNGVFDGAWVIVAAEESKGLGNFLLDDEGGLCLPDDPLCEADIGKNQWYFSFDMGEPQTSATMSHPNGLVQNLVNQGNMLNQPEVNWQTGGFYPPIDTSASWGISVPFYIFNTEIARRSSLLVQSIAKARASASGILATPSWKQGVMRQGGPADTMLRRFVLPDNYEDGLDNNPYAFENMVCDEWMPEGENNPYYPGGVCAESATNLSSVVPDTCIDDGSDAGDPTVDCPTVDFTQVSQETPFGFGDTDPILRGVVQGEGNTTRVLTWHQCPSDGTAITNSSFTPVDCGADGTIADNLTDQSWYNPLDISKGHRGFIDGDFVMFLYAWSPNWRLNAKGSDRYDLYIRRSFDGGLTWTTTPGALGGDGTVTCETYRTGETQNPEAVEPRVCYEYASGGAAEQARNVTQHSKMKYTTLDPRYAATPASITEFCLDGLAPSDPEIPFDMTNWGCDDGSVHDGTRNLDSDLRDPSRFFIVFETGDNTTVKVGEAEPEDLFYSRAEGYGDDYVVWTETDTGFDADPEAICYPSVAYDDASVDGTVVVGSGFCNEFERMNAKGNTHASEANLEANPAGSKLYGVWTQSIVEIIDELNNIEETVDSEASMRRTWWIDNYRSLDPADTWILQGTNQSQ